MIELQYLLYFVQKFIATKYIEYFQYSYGIAYIYVFADSKRAIK